MLELQRTYGKTIHTWAIDQFPDLPLGPPNLMMSYTDDGQIPHDMIKARDERLEVDTDAKKKLRQGYLPGYVKSPEADQWEKTGKGIVFEPEEKGLVREKSNGTATSVGK